MNILKDEEELNNKQKTTEYYLVTWKSTADTVSTTYLIEKSLFVLAFSKDIDLKRFVLKCRPSTKINIKQSDFAFDINTTKLNGYRAFAINNLYYVNVCTPIYPTSVDYVEIIKGEEPKYIIKNIQKNIQYIDNNIKNSIKFFTNPYIEKIELYQEKIYNQPQKNNIIL